MDSCRAQEIHVVLANGSGYAPRQIPVVRQNRTAQYHVDIMKDDLTQSIRENYDRLAEAYALRRQ